MMDEESANRISKDEYKKKVLKENKTLLICKIFPISAYLGFIGIFINIIVYFYICIFVMFVLGII